MIKKKILIVVGTRPNFIKVTQFKKVAANFPALEFKIVHTGQHYDIKMADVFFEQFKLFPDFFLNISQGTASDQITQIMISLEELVNTSYKPDMMIVVGDVNSTLAAATVANKLNISLAHLESGLRSFDSTMPEEHNRILTDAITNSFFITEDSGMINLLAEGKDKAQMHFVGNTMIDTIVAFDKEIQASDVEARLGIKSGEYVLMTMHRPATVDHSDGLKQLIELINVVTKKYKIVFPIHPRTLKNIEAMGLAEQFKNNKQLILSEPMDYFSFQKAICGARFILTDSGGIQEESTFRKIPCLTLRPNTERPVTVTEGTNTLVPFEIQLINKYISEIEEGKYKKGSIPKNWDGNSTQRIVKIIDTILSE